MEFPRDPLHLRADESSLPRGEPTAAAAGAEATAEAEVEAEAFEGETGEEKPKEAPRSAAGLAEVE